MFKEWFKLYSPFLSQKGAWLSTNTLKKCGVDMPIADAVKLFSVAYPDLIIQNLSGRYLVTRQDAYPQSTTRQTPDRIAQLEARIARLEKLLLS